MRLVRVGEMAGNLEGVFAVDYRPLVATDDQKPEEAELSFDIEELGTYRCVCLCNWSVFSDRGAKS